MDDNRFQEIKRGIGMVRGLEPVTSTEAAIAFCLELITAYENQGELLQLSLANVDRLNEELVEKQKLADDFMKLMNDHIDDAAQLRKQLAEAQAEADAAWRQMKISDKGNKILQAEDKQLRDRLEKMFTMMEEGDLSEAFTLLYIILDKKEDI